MMYEAFVGATKFSLATYAEIPADENLNHPSTLGCRNLQSLTRRLALKPQNKTTTSFCSA
jgi:hypothetical protein